jgi:hypothetical protein
LRRFQLLWSLFIELRTEQIDFLKLSQSTRTAVTDALFSLLGKEAAKKPVEPVAFALKKPEIKETPLKTAR